MDHMHSIFMMVFSSLHPRPDSGAEYINAKLLGLYNSNEKSKHL